MEKKNNNKRLSLEKIINNLFARIQKLEKNKEIQIKDFFGSKIILNENEFNFIAKEISPKNNISLQLLFSSDINKENVEDLKSAYIGKKDLLFLIKTTKDKRFGGYAHESFELKEFDKIDKNAFLFNINQLEIYRASGNDTSIWKDSVTINSINFGGGTDLKINHKFLSEKNYTKPNGDLYYNYNKKEYALNGELYFEISILELFKVIFH